MSRRRGRDMAVPLALSPGVGAMPAWAADRISPGRPWAGPGSAELAGQRGPAAPIPGPAHTRQTK